MSTKLPALQYPGYGWSVFAPTDNIVPAAPHQLAEWSWVQKEVPQRFLRRHLPLMGPGWMHKVAVSFLLARGTIQWEDIQWSFQPSCVLPEGTFRNPCAR